MGCRLRDIYGTKYTIGIAQKKFCEKLGVNHGIIIPIYYFSKNNYGEVRYPEFYKLLEEYPHLLVKHCDNPDIMTHIVPDGIVNRFGIMLTDVPPTIKTSLDIEVGWVKAKGFMDVDAIKSELTIARKLKTQKEYRIKY